MVLPVPGAPYRRMPLAGCSSSLVYSSGCDSGASKEFLCARQPPVRTLKAGWCHSASCGCSGVISGHQALLGGLLWECRAEDGAQTCSGGKLKHQHAADGSPLDNMLLHAGRRSNHASSCRPVKGNRVGDAEVSGQTPSGRIYRVSHSTLGLYQHHWILLSLVYRFV